MNTKLKLSPTYAHHSHTAVVAAASVAPAMFAVRKSTAARSLLNSRLRLHTLSVASTTVPRSTTCHTFKSKYRRTYAKTTRL